MKIRFAFVLSIFLAPTFTFAAAHLGLTHEEVLRLTPRICHQLMAFVSAGMTGEPRMIGKPKDAEALGDLTEAKDWHSQIRGLVKHPTFNKDDLNAILWDLQDQLKLSRFDGLAVVEAHARESLTGHVQERVLKAIRKIRKEEFGAAEIAKAPNGSLFDPTSYTSSGNPGKSNATNLRAPDRDNDTNGFQSNARRDLENRE